MTGGAVSLDAAALDAAFAILRPAGLVLVAISGGPDSVALLGTLARWSRASGRPPLAAATVDHALRPGSRAEAESVGRFCDTLDIPHTILTWRRDAAASDTSSHAAARDARYRLLLGEAARIGATHLALGHHRDDQAETLLIRMACGSGLAGLAGMAALSQRGDVVLARPFLAIDKAALVAACRAERWPFVDDPSNVEPRFARARWRDLAPALSAEGLDAERLGTLAARLRRADAALSAMADHAFVDARESEDGSGLALRLDRLARQPDEIGLRVLGRALENVGEGPVRLERLEACHAAFREALSDGRPLRRTLAGCVLTLDRAGRFLVAREGPRRRGHAALTLLATETPCSLGREADDP